MAGQKQGLMPSLRLFRRAVYVRTAPRVQIDLPAKAVCRVDTVAASVPWRPQAIAIRDMQVKRRIRFMSAALIPGARRCAPRATH